MELRISLEADAAYYAAIRRDENDLLAMKKTIAKMRDIHLKDRSDKGMQMLQHESLNFHRSIMEATKNSVWQSVYGQLLSLLQLSRQYMTARLVSRQDPLGDHEAIYRKIEAQGAEGARVYMKKHLIDTKDSYNAIINEDNNLCQ